MRDPLKEPSSPVRSLPRGAWRRITALWRARHAPGSTVAVVVIAAVLLLVVGGQDRVGITLVTALLLAVIVAATLQVGARSAETVLVATERRLLRDSEERFRRVFEEGLTGKFLVSSSGRILQANSTMVRLTGRSHAETLGDLLPDSFVDAVDRQRVEALLDGRGATLRGEMLLRAQTGSELWGHVAMMWITEHDGGRVLLVQVEDVTGRRAAEQQLITMALHDQLTGLPNRRLLFERSEHAFAIARSGQGVSSWVSILFIDLDGFKAVNDWAGHDAGDRLLAEIAEDLRGTVRSTDTVARLGGDEFVVLVSGDEGPEDLPTLAARLMDAVRRPVREGAVDVVVSASVGMARADLLAEPDLRPEQLIDRADAAMYRAKQRGKDRHDL